MLLALLLLLVHDYLESGDRRAIPKSYNLWYPGIRFTMGGCFSKVPVILRLGPR
jgi:hypothetical protein